MQKKEVRQERFARLKQNIEQLKRSARFAARAIPLLALLAALPVAAISSFRDEVPDPNAPDISLSTGEAGLSNAQLAARVEMWRRNQNILTIICTPSDREQNITLDRVRDQFEGTSTAPYPMKDFIAKVSMGQLHTDSVRYLEGRSSQTYAEMMDGSYRQAERCITEINGPDAPDEGIIALYVPGIRGGYDGLASRYQAIDPDTGEQRDYALIYVSQAYFTSTIPHELVHALFFADHERDYRGRPYETTWAPTGMGSYNGAMAAVLEYNGLLPEEERVTVPYSHDSPELQFMMEGLYAPENDPNAIRMLEITDVPWEVIERMLQLEDADFPDDTSFSVIVERRVKELDTIDQHSPDEGFVVTIAETYYTYRFPKYYRLYFPRRDIINPLREAWKPSMRFTVPSGEPALNEEGKPELSVCFHHDRAEANVANIPANVTVLFDGECQQSERYPFQQYLPKVSNGVAP
jgi:hypothetical protein